METKINNFFYWTPRILAILFTGFLFLMSLDVFSPESTWWQIAVGLFMHNIPAFIMLAVVIISWKREIVGGIAFILFGLVYIFLLSKSNDLPWYIALSWSMTIAGPAFLTGIFFLLNWSKKRKSL